LPRYCSFGLLTRTSISTTKPQNPGGLPRFATNRSGALLMLHEHPQEAWRVDLMARRVALSRSAFAKRFRELVGESPLHYLTRLRINAAAIRLGTTDEKLRCIAASVGYSSVPALVKSFKRLMGTTPGDYRRHHDR